MLHCKKSAGFWSAQMQSVSASGSGRKLLFGDGTKLMVEISEFIQLQMFYGFKSDPETFSFINFHLIVGL